MPALDDAYQQNREHSLQVLLVNLKEKSTEALSFMGHIKYKSTVLLDGHAGGDRLAYRREAAKKIHISGTTRILDNTGKMVFRSNGSVNWQSAKMESLLNQLPVRSKPVLII